MPQRPLKVCFVLPSLADGGAERVAVTVLNALDATTIERILYLFSGEGVYRDQIASDVRVVVGRRTGRLARLLDLSRFLRLERPDVVMPFLSYFTAAVATKLSGSGARVVFNQGTPTTSFLDDPDFTWRVGGWRRLFASATRIFFARADAVVVTSEGVAADLSRHYDVPRSRIRVLHNPVDIGAVSRAASDDGAVDVTGEGNPLVVAAGRLAAVKNYPLLLEALTQLKDRFPIHAWILGDGAERARLERLAADAGLGDRIRFLGFQQNPWRFIARGDVFVLTSRYEGFGNVLIEAMACGVPVVATRSAGAEEIVTDGVNGLLVDHQPEAVAGAITRILSDAGLRQRLVSQALKDVERYAIDRVAGRYTDLFLSLCDERA